VQVLNKLGKPEENAKLQAPANSSSAKEAVVHEESVCTVTGLSPVFSRKLAEKCSAALVCHVYE